MKYDIVIVSYNSVRWLPDCVQALADLQYDLGELNLIAVDNASTDESVAVLKDLKAKYTGFGGFEILAHTKNLGFGGGCNAGAKAGKAPFVFMLNIDTKIEPDAMTEMDKAIATDKNGEAGAFEMRQKPVEVGRHNDPVTMECAWNSGACVVYRRAVYEQMQGFDEHMFMYCEDVDLSWRIRAAGYKLIYVPRASVYHFTRRGDKQKEFHEYAWTAYNKLMMHYKYDNLRGILKGHRDYIHTLRRPVHFDYVRRVLLKNYCKHFLHFWPFFAWRFRNAELKKKVPATYIEGFEIMRSLYEFKPLKARPLVSIIMRTSSRPEVLRQTLMSLRHQTYDNFEVVVEEDGPATAQAMIEADFKDLNISYEATGQRIGRGKAGNRALARAKGEFFNFLDDDDFFYPEHIELMLSTFEQEPESKFVANGYMMYLQNTISGDPYVYDRKKIEYHGVERIDLITMCKRDQLPILSVMFRRELYDKMGGLREDIDANEDWSMWLRFLVTKPKHSINTRATSAFVFPEDEAVKKAKLESYRKYYHAVFEDDSLVFEVTAKEMNQMYNDVLAEMQHLVNLGLIHGYLYDNLQF